MLFVLRPRPLLLVGVVVCSNEAELLVRCAPNKKVDAAAPLGDVGVAAGALLFALLFALVFALVFPMAIAPPSMVVPVGPC